MYKYTSKCGGIINSIKMQISTNNNAKFASCSVTVGMKNPSMEKMGLSVEVQFSKTLQAQYDYKIFFAIVI